MEKGLVLVLGASGRTGQHVVKQLVQDGFFVRIVARKAEAIKKAFPPQIYEKIEDVIQCDLYQESKQMLDKIKKKQYNSILELAFKEGPNKCKVKYVVSALGQNLKTKDQSMFVDYYAQRLVMEISKKFQVEKYVLVSSSFILRPYALVSQIINFFADNCMHWKLKAENYLRKSGLNYAIVRPMQLMGQDLALEPAGITLDQGDKAKAGVIARPTVARAILQCLTDKTIPDKVTFECFTTKQQEKEKFAWPKCELKPDTPKDIVQISHLKARRNVNLLILSFLMIVAMILLKIFYK